MTAVRILVSGRVQGVGFRAWTQRRARALNLRGSAENLADGRVEIHAEGDQSSCDALVDALRGSSTPGTVTEVDVRPDEPTGAEDFTAG